MKDFNLKKFIKNFRKKMQEIFLKMHRNFLKYIFGQKISISKENYKFLKFA